MEPILTTLVAAAATFGRSALGKAAETAVTEGWAALKSAIARRKPEASEAPKLIEDLRAAPESPAAPSIVQRLDQLGVSSDPEIAAAIRSLIAALKSAGAGTTVNAPKADTVYGAQVSYGSTTFNFNNRD